MPFASSILSCLAVYYNLVPQVVLLIFFFFFAASMLTKRMLIGIALIYDVGASRASLSKALYWCSIRY